MDQNSCTLVCLSVWNLKNWSMKSFQIFRDSFSYGIPMIQLYFGDLWYIKVILIEKFWMKIKN